MNEPLVVLDADVLGRRRTGDETYVAALLAELAKLDHGLRLAAVTRRPELVPEGVEPVQLRARSQIVRMSVRLPRLLRRLAPRLAHFQHVVPPGCRFPAVVTIHDLSFERHPEVTSRRDRLIFRTMVPRSVHRAARVLAVSEWTKRDIVEHYGVSEGSVVVTPNGVDSIFAPGGARADGAPYALFVGTLQPRKDPLAALEALALVPGDLRLVLVGPDKGSGTEARQAASRLGLNARVEFAGHVEKRRLAELYRSAACLVFPSRYEGFGLPVVEAMASGTPVVAAAGGSVPEVAGDAAVLVEPGDPVALAGGIERALADRERLVRAGLERATQFSWAETARRTLDVYRELL
jgi:glycosyltransferase involved in cell wall biosynthesis